MSASPAAKTLSQRLFTWLWRRPRFRREFYNLIGLVYRRTDRWRTMNCGYLPPHGAALCPAGYDSEQHGYELYAQLTAGTVLKDRDVLELGSGRGGGASFLHSTAHPRRLVALDYAPRTVRWCRKNFARPGLEFVCGDAAHPPFPAASFDVIVAVEVTHCLHDKPAFLAAAAAVLKKNGRLLIADFFYRRPDSMHALEKFQAALAGSAFDVVVEEDWTAGVIAAIEADSARRAAEIHANVPRPLQKLALGFTSTTESSTYTALRAGRTVYRRYTLEKRTAPA